MKNKKHLSIFDAILFTFSAVFVIDSFGLATTFGWQSIFWWIIIGIIFFIPYGLMTAELGSTYSKKGRGVEYWVSRAYGKKGSAFLGFFYWVNVAFWMASVYLILANTLIYVIDSTFFDHSWYAWITLAIAIFATWLTVGINFMKIGDAKWFPNLSAIIKFLVVLIMLIVMFIYLGKGGAIATPLTSMKDGKAVSAFKPDFAISLGIIGIIVYNLAGFELNSNMSEEMANPKKAILKSIFYGGIAILCAYVIATIPILILSNTTDSAYYDDEIYTYAVVAAVDQLAIQYGVFFKIFTYITAILISLTLLGNMITWTLGANRAARDSSKFGELPKSFAKSNKNNIPTNVTIYTGIISTLVSIVATVFTKFVGGDIWYMVFSFSMVLFFVPYIIIFSAFIKLRKIDKDVKREFSAGPDWFAKLIGIIGIVVICIALFTQNFNVVLGSEITIKPLEEIGGWLGVLLSISGNLLTIFIGWLLIKKSLKENKLLNKDYQPTLNKKIKIQEKGALYHAKTVKDNS